MGISINVVLLSICPLISYPVVSIWYLLWSIVFFCIIVMVAKRYMNKKEETQRQEGLNEYCRQRSIFYRQERERILERFRQKAKRQGKLTHEDFAEVKYLMEINGADEGDWLEEYEKFCSEYQQPQ